MTGASESIEGGRRATITGGSRRWVGGTGEKGKVKIIILRKETSRQSSSGCYLLRRALHVDHMYFSLP